jgi:hypothetical protein
VSHELSEVPLLDPLAQLASLNAPTAEIEDMIAEIGSGRADRFFD